MAGKVMSHDDKQIKSSQYSKNKKELADEMREEIRILIQKQDDARIQARKSVEEN